MKVLVTGAAGFIGSHLCEALLREGCVVTGADNFDPYYGRSIKEKNLLGPLAAGSFDFIELDLRDEEATASLVARGWDCIAHMGGRPGVRRSISEPGLTMDINFKATLNLLEGMKSAGGGRLVFASTSSVYGESPRIPFREDDPADRPVSPYSASKRACELLCHTYHKLYGLDVYALRFFTVYGPRQRPDMAIHKFVHAISNGRPVERYGDGSTHRDYTYVDDIVTGVVKAVERAKGYEIINIGGARTTPLASLIQTIERLLGKKAQVIEKPIPPGDVLRTQADNAKAARLLDMSPRVGLEEGLGRFIHWYEKEQIP